MPRARRACQNHTGAEKRGAQEPRQPYTAKSAMTMIAPMKPSFFADDGIDKIGVALPVDKKDFCCFHIRPTPVNPPEPTAMRDWMS